MKPYIHSAFWSDSEVEVQLAEVKLCALWVITNSQRSVLGVCQTTGRRFSFETGLEARVLDGVCDALPGMFRRVGRAIFIRGFIRHQFGSGEKLIRNNWFKALAAEFLNIKNKELRAAILEEYPEFLEVGKNFKERKAADDAGEKPEAGDAVREVLRAHAGFVAAWREWRQHLADLGKPMVSRGQETTVLLDCGRHGPERAMEVIRFSIGKGARNLIWDDAPRSKATLKALAKPPEPDPAGWREWLAEHYPDKGVLAYARCPEAVRVEFRTERRRVAA